MVANEASNKRPSMQTIAIISQNGGAGYTNVGIRVATERRGMNTPLFGLDPRASPLRWSGKRNKPSPDVMSARAARLPSLLIQAAAQSANLVFVESAPNADTAS